MALRSVRRLVRRAGRPLAAGRTGPPQARPSAAAAELVLIAIKDCREAPALVDAGRRLAARLCARWTILHVETLHALRASERERHEMAETLRAAQALGGGAAHYAGDDVAAAVAQHGRLYGATHLVAGAARPGWLRRPSLGAQAAAQMPGVCLLEVAPAAAAAPGPYRAPIEAGPAWPYAVCLAMVAAAGAAAAALSPILPDVGLSVVFLTAVLVAATEFGPGPALFTSLLSLVCYDFFFLTPIYSFAIGSTEGLTAFFTFGLAALISSRFATRLRGETYAARQRAAEAADLHRLTRGLAGAATLGQAAAAIAAATSVQVGRPAAVLAAAGEGQAEISRVPKDAGFAAEDRAAAMRCLDPGPDGLQEALSPGSWRFRPVRMADRIVGVLGVQEGRRPLPLGKEHRLAAIMEQGAIAIDRITLVGDLEQERQRDATDRLHAALLASISHDLRGPLTAILGSATALETHGRTLPENVAAELATTVREEAARLDGLVANLLDMARLEGTAFRARLVPTDVGELAGASLQRAQAVLGARPLALEVAEGLPLVPLDPVLLDQVLFNLMDNAAQHAGPGTPVTLRVLRAGSGVRLLVQDEGGGFRPEQVGRVFDKFFQGAPGRRGAGLGLAICRGFVEAMHGRIAAANRTDGPGAQITIDFPAPSAGPAASASLLDQCDA